MRDLIVLVPDKNTEYAVRGALTRSEALGIRPVTATVLVEPNRDGGVRVRGPQTVQVERPRFAHALIILDYEGSGAAAPASELERSLDEQLAYSWGPDGKAIVVEPEVDVWMWGAESHLRAVAGWTRAESPRQYLTERGFAFSQHDKPLRPKEALQELFREAQIPRSSANYQAIAAKVSLTKCQDPAFRRLRNTLTGWFGAVASPDA